MADIPALPPLPSDEALAAQVAEGNAEALQALHQRYAPLVFHVACKSLDRPAAEEITQDVFLALWTRASTFDAARGSLKSWLLQIAHHRIVNELRTRSRRPQSAPDAGEKIDELLAHDSAPDEAVWREYQRSALQRALRALPQAQRQALSLAYFDELSHEEVARSLQVPLGTAKTRIRTGLQKLSSHLAMLVAVGLLVVTASSALYLRREGSRSSRALQMLTSSHAQTLRLLPPGFSGDPEQAMHAAFRGEPGVPTAVLTLSRFQPAPSGRHYELWALQRGAWVDLGTVAPDAAGHALRILEAPALAAWPEALRLTLEADGARATAPGEAEVAWDGRPGPPRADR
ncbi:MAG TPA: sigma-70 family RNA polymerase sigma factor [Holophagaceae bacterium]|nr:sigma-70 family RNA polymerase sigma factor [Holophagaceae bacterium]